MQTSTAYQDNNSFLTEHIPYRIGSLHLAVQIYDHFLQKNPMDTLKGRHIYKDAELALGIDQNAPQTVRLLTNPIVETATIHCRQLAEFLGIKKDRNSDNLIFKLLPQNKLNPKNETMYLTHFINLNPHPDLDRYRDIIRQKADVDIANAFDTSLLVAIKAGHKAVAHLTRKAFDPDRSPEFLRYACIILSELINYYLQINHLVPRIAFYSNINGIEH